MKKAWQYDYDLISNAVPKFSSDTKPVDWSALKAEGDKHLERARKNWINFVSESRAPYSLMINAIQSMESMGYNVENATELIPAAYKAVEEDNLTEVMKLNSRIYSYLFEADKIEDHPYHKYTVYENFQQYKDSVDFPIYDYKIPDSEEFFNKIYGGWMAEIAGAALGTALEGYQFKNIKKVFGEINGYIKFPETYNDDITFELALLEVFTRKGYDMTSRDIAEEWVAIIPFGWTAEEVALENLKMGIYPPQSGYHANYFREMVGAQMRAAICGVLAPGNPELAAKLAWTDGVVSHHNNGVLAEVFNAVMVSIAYCEDDMAIILKKAIGMIPKDSECYEVLRFSYEQCEKHSSYEDAWLVCEDRFKEYNWVHAYPNLAAEVVAIYYAGNDFNKMMSIIGIVGQDVDCTAGPVGHVYGTLLGFNNIDVKWTEPLKDNITTYVRGMEKINVQSLSKKTMDAIIKFK